MHGKIASWSLGLVLSFTPAYAGAFASVENEEERGSWSTYKKVVVYVGGGLAALYGLYNIAHRRPPLGGLFFGLAVPAGMDEPGHPPVAPRPGPVGNEFGAAHGCVQQAIAPPLRRVDVVRPTPPAPISPRSLEHVRVLVVEDQSIQERIIVHRLSAVGAVVDVARDADAAVDAVQHSPRGQQYDVVLMDNQMPETQGGPVVADAGLGAATRIRAMSDPTHERPPVVIMHSSNSISPGTLRRVGAATEIVKGPSKTEFYVDTILDHIERRKDK